MVSPEGLDGKRVYVICVKTLVSGLAEAFSDTTRTAEKIESRQRPRCASRKNLAGLNWLGVYWEEST
jgi:hypothetical protein